MQEASFYNISSKGFLLKLMSSKRTISSDQRFIFLVLLATCLLLIGIESSDDSDNCSQICHSTSYTGCKICYTECGEEEKTMTLDSCTQRYCSQYNYSNGYNYYSGNSTGYYSNGHYNTYSNSNRMNRTCIHYDYKYLSEYACTQECCGEPDYAAFTHQTMGQCVDYNENASKVLAIVLGTIGGLIALAIATCCICSCVKGKWGNNAEGTHTCGDTPQPQECQPGISNDILQHNAGEESGIGMIRKDFPLPPLVVPPSVSKQQQQQQLQRHIEEQQRIQLERMRSEQNQKQISREVWNYLDRNFGSAANRVDPEIHHAKCMVCLSVGVECMTCCGHACHMACLVQWLQTNPNCPACQSNALNPVTVFCLGCEQRQMQCVVSHSTEVSGFQSSSSGRILCDLCMSQNAQISDVQLQIDFDDVPQRIASEPPMTETEQEPPEQQETQDMKKTQIQEPKETNSALDQNQKVGSMKSIQENQNQIQVIEQQENEEAKKED